METEKEEGKFPTVAFTEPDTGTVPLMVTLGIEPTFTDWLGARETAFPTSTTPDMAGIDVTETGPSTCMGLGRFVISTGIGLGKFASVAVTLELAYAMSAMGVGGGSWSCEVRQLSVFVCVTPAMNVEQIKVKPLQWFEGESGTLIATGFYFNQYKISPDLIGGAFWAKINGTPTFDSSTTDGVKKICDDYNAKQVHGYFSMMEDALNWVENPEAIQQPDAPLMQKLGRMEAVLDELHFPVEARNVVETILVTGHQIGLDLTVLNLRDEVAGFVHNGIKVEVGKSGAVYKYGSLTDEEGTLLHDPRNPDHANTLPLVWRAFL